MEFGTTTTLIFDPTMGKSIFQTQTQGLENFFWGSETIFMAKVGPNAVNFSIAEMIGQFLTLTTHPIEQEL